MTFLRRQGTYSVGTKHDLLTEEELAEFQVGENVIAFLKEYQEKQGLEPNQINVVDWGCGRGRSVAKLRELGFNAFGVEIDRRTMQNGFDLLKSRGMEPESVLRHFDEISHFDDGYFDFVFSEQVLEHVENIDDVATEMGRLTKLDGVGFHQFPGSKTVEEVHLFQPLIHWLPKNIIRRIAIFCWLLLGRGPNTWPEAKGKSRWRASDVYFRYSAQKTYYREVRKLCAAFQDHGFETAHSTLGTPSHWVPEFLKRNGFPAYNIVIMLRKTA